MGLNTLCGVSLVHHWYILQQTSLARRAVFSICVIVMTMGSALIYLVATVLLIHATYSAYEFSLFRKHHTTAVTDLGLPLDVS
uniref:ARAD1A11044p n=1 Tax=Blastobotrys adeninivorans TaxID=409370 RepID=A0A060T3N1_BLAAD